MLYCPECNTKIEKKEKFALIGLILGIIETLGLILMIF